VFRDNAAFTPRQGGLRPTDGRKNLNPDTLTLFPRGKGFPHRIFLALKPSALNNLRDKRLLVGGKLHFHRLHSMGKLARGKL
jgi:hypothetical protein